MTARTRPPFRADHVGSLLRPPRAAAGARGPRGRPHRRRRAARRSRTRRSATSSRRQEDVGLRSATDGEFRRASWHMDFIYGLGGVTRAQAEHDHGPVPQRRGRRSSSRRPRCTSTRRVALEEPIFARRLRVPAVVRRRPRRRSSRSRRRAWSTTAAAGPRSPRTSIPTSTRSGRPRRARTPTRCARSADLGCTYLQFDDTSLAYLNDPKQREMIASSAATPSTSTSATSATSTRRSPAGPRTWRSRRTCAAATSAPRGSPRAATTSSPRRCSASSPSTASSSSGTTSARAASSRCASCRRARPSCSASSRPSAASSRPRTTLKRRIEEASQYVDLDQLCLSPQCGFSSTVEGNAITVEQQWAKLAARRRDGRRGLGRLTARQTVMPWCARSSPPS